MGLIPFWANSECFPLCFVDKWIGLCFSSSISVLKIFPQLSQPKVGKTCFCFLCNSFWELIHVVFHVVYFIYCENYPLSWYGIFELEVSEVIFFLKIDFHWFSTWMTHSLTTHPYLYRISGSASFIWFLVVDANKIELIERVQRMFS